MNENEFFFLVQSNKIASSIQLRFWSQFARVSNETWGTEVGS